MRFTPEEYAQQDEEIARMWEAGKTYGEIADSLQLTLSAITLRISRLRSRGIMLSYRRPGKPRSGVRFPSAEERAARPLDRHQITSALRACGYI